MMRFVWLFCFSCSLWAWNAKGHELIGELALSYVKPETRVQILKDFRTFSTDVDEISTWMDKVRHQPQFSKFNHFHYVDIPFGRTQYFPGSFQSDNAIRAILMSEKMLRNPHAHPHEKLLALRILFHVIGDIHQPMHTINYYSHHFPHGDRGGNAYHLPKKTGYANLHKLWDEGGGLFQKVHPHDFHGVCHKKLDNPMRWVQASHQIALEHAYFPPRSKLKMQIYKKEAMAISRTQIENAACHLAAYLDDIYDKP